jgi:SAM-dependent methyltransferase
VVQAGAEQLPFPDDSFDVALALMTVHHWRDLGHGLAEMRRVARRQIVLAFDPAVHDSLWIFQEYVPAIFGLSDHAPADAVADALQADRVEVIPVPADCTDGFITAYWRRPAQYLIPSVRAGMSGFARLPAGLVDPGMERLAEDLSSGAWHQRHADLMTMDSIDAGLRLIVAN